MHETWQGYTFCREFNSVSFVTMTSHCHWKHPKRNSVLLLFLWSKGLNANAIHTDMHSVYGGSVLWDHQYMFGVRSLLVVKKVLWRTTWPWPNSQQSAASFKAFTNLLLDRINAKMNMEDMFTLLFDLKNVCLLTLGTFSCPVMLFKLTLSCRRITGG